MKKITLIGMPGAGKTTIGKELSKELGIDFIDIDSEIEFLQEKNISDIFAQFGEKYFRKIESELIIKYAQADKNTIISTGGGAFENSESRDILISNTTVIYLKASPAILFDRTKNNKSRPLLNNNNIKLISELLNIREKNYKLAHYTILTDNKTVQEIVKEILGVTNNNE